MVNKVTELVTVLIQMQNNKVLCWCICNFSHIFISWNLINFSILDLLSMIFKLSHSVSIELFGEVIIKIKIILHFFELLLILLWEYIFKFVLLLIFLFHFCLFLVKSFFLLVGKIITMLDLKVKPFSSDFVGHFGLLGESNKNSI